MTGKSCGVSVTEKLRLVLVPTGGVAPGAGAELRAALEAGVPDAAPAPEGKFRPVEFPGEVVEEAVERVRELAAQNPRREAELQQNPPAPDERAVRLKELAAQIAADVRELFDLGFLVKIELQPDGASATE